MEKTYPPLTTYRIFYNDRTSRVVNCAAEITLKDAQKYFLNQWFEQSDEKTVLQCIDVEEFR